MPDFDVRAMKQDDRRAIYRFIISPAPACMPPGQKPQLPCWELVLPPAPPAPAPAAG